MGTSVKHLWCIPSRGHGGLATHQLAQQMIAADLSDSVWHLHSLLSHTVAHTRLPRQILCAVTTSTATRAAMPAHEPPCGQV
jgi:hypothetical protein